MRTAGQVLQAVRIQKKQDLVDVARITRIRTQYLEALELDDYRKLPSGTVAKGFIKNYSEFLGLNPEHILAIFRRDFVENQQGQIIPRGMSSPVGNTSLWTPKTTIIAVMSTILTVFAAYLIYQYHILTGPPPLSVTLPFDNFVTSETTVEVSGVTDPEATLSINDQLVILEKGGRFAFRVPITSGENTLLIVASSKSGKMSTVNRKVVLK